MSRSRSFCFTINNPIDDDESQLRVLATKAQYLVVGREKGECGTPHYQGYVYFKEAKTFTSLKKKLTRAHIEVCKGTPASNIEYCKKQGDVFIEQGHVPKQGERTDIDHIRDELKAGANMKRVAEVASSFQAIKVAEVWLKYHEKPRTWKPEVRWYYGSTGSGKTRSAREWLGDEVYTCLDSIKWFEGYDGHKNVLIDDFRKDWCKFHQLLKLLDRYEYRVETKGGSRQFVAEKIAVTAPYHPENIYSTREDVNQLLRRIDEVVLVGDPVDDDKDDVDYIDH